MQLWYFLSGRSALALAWKHLRPNLRIIWDIYRVGLPSLLIQVSGNLAVIIANQILGGFGYIPIAVMGIVLHMQMLAFMPVIGISQGLIPIVGYNFGAKTPAHPGGLIQRGRRRQSFLDLGRAGLLPLLRLFPADLYR